MKNLLCSLLFALASAFASANCFDLHGQRHGIEPDLLRAVAMVESSGNPKAVSGNKDSEDIGLMQINSSWLSKWNLRKSDLLNDVCLNVEVAAKILKDNFKRFSNPWEAVGAYNAGCSRLKGEACSDARKKYAWKVWRALTQLNEKTVGKLNRLAS